MRKNHGSVDWHSSTSLLLPDQPRPPTFLKIMGRMDRQIKSQQQKGKPNNMIFSKTYNRSKCEHEFRLGSLLNIETKLNKKPMLVQRNSSTGLKRKETMSKVHGSKELPLQTRIVSATNIGRSPLPAYNVVVGRRSLHCTKRDESEQQNQQNVIRLSIGSFVEKLDRQFELRKKKIAHEGAQKLIRENQVPLIAEEWFQASLDNRVLSPYFRKKNKAVLTHNFTDYISLMFRNDKSFDYKRMREIHSFGIQRECFSSAKSTLFSIMYQLNKKSVGICTIYYGCRQMEKFRSCFSVINELQAQMDDGSMVEDLQSRLQLSPLISRLLVHFLLTYESLDQLLQAIKASKARMGAEEVALAKAVILKYCGQLSSPLELTLQVLQNFRFIDVLVREGIHIGDYLRKAHGGLDRLKDQFVAGLQKEGLFTKKEVRLCQVLIYQLLSCEEFSFSHRQVKDITKNDFGRDLYFQIANKLFGFLKAKKFPVQILDYVKKELLALWSVLGSETTFCQKSYDEVVCKLAKKQSAYREHTTRYKKDLCQPGVIGLIMEGCLNVSKEDVRSIHKGLRISSQDYQFYQYCFLEYGKKDPQFCEAFRKMSQRYKHCVVAQPLPLTLQ